MKATETRPWLKYADPELLKLEMPRVPVMDFFLELNQTRMDRPGLNYYDRIITLREVYENSCITANAFASLGLKKGDYVAVIAPMTPEIVYTFYGLSMLGVIPNMIDPRYSVDGIRDCVEKVNAKCVLFIDAMYDKVVEVLKDMDMDNVIALSPAESLPKLLRFAYLLKNPMKDNMPEGYVYWGDFIKQGKDFKAEYLHDHSDTCCLIIHTGGTSSKAKSVMLSHDNINAVAFQFFKSLMHNNHSISDKFLDIMPPFCSYGFGYGIHLPLCTDQVSIIIPQFEQKNFAKLILKHKPQNLAGVPAYFLSLMDDKRMKNADLSYFLNIGLGGDGISLENEARLNEWMKAHGVKHPVNKGYGMTELAAVSTACYHGVNRPGSVGIPHADYLMAAFDPETGEELEIGESGEICVHGPTMMIGYFGDPEHTAQTLRTHSDGLTWVHTGDLGHMDEDGFVYIEGRLKRVIIRFDGNNVYPGAIEEVINTHEDVMMVTAVGVDDIDAPQGQRPYVFYTVRPECKKSESEITEEISDLCKKALAERMQPKYYSRIDKMPLTPLGKVDYRELEKRADKAVKG